MLIHVNDAVSLQGARTLQHPFIIPYGVHQEYELQIVTGRDNHPVDVESRGCVKWTLTVTPSHETPTTVLAYAVFPENIATGSVIRFDLAATSVEMYKHVAGNPATPAVLQLLGFTSEDAPAALSLALPVALVTTAQQRLPVDLSTALMQELQLATATVGAAQREISRLMADSDFAADSAAQSAAEAAASAENAQHSAQDAAASAQGVEQHAAAAAGSAQEAAGSATAAAGSANAASGYSDDARLAAQAAEYARDGAVDAKVLAESAQSSAESAASTAAATTSAAIETQFRDDITATGDAATAAQTAAVAAQGSQQASAGSALSAQQSAQLAYEYARQAGQNVVLVLDSAPTIATAGGVGQLAVWHDSATNKDHIYHLCFISVADSSTLYHWEECVLESGRNVAGGFAGIASNGKIPSSLLSLPKASISALGAIMLSNSFGSKVDSFGALYIARATNNGIDAKTNSYHTIVPSNLDYAVRSVLPNVTVIPAVTSDYSLVDSSATTNNHSHVYSHSPSSTAPTYRLPQVTNTAIAHYIELTVDFTAVQTYSFLDYQGEPIVPLFTPAIAAGDVYTFKMEYSAIKSAWLIYPQKQGAVADDFVMRGEVGAANGVAGLNSNGLLNYSNIPVATSSQLGGVKYSSSKTYGVGLNTNNVLVIHKAPNNIIDGRTSMYYPIVADNLNYAVTAALTDSHHITLNDAQKATAQSVFGVGGPITAIPAATSQYTLSYGRFSHVPELASVYALPAVADGSIANDIVLSIKFSASVLTYEFQDSNGTTLVPLPLNGDIEAGSVVTFLCRYNPLLAQWVIYPVMDGKEAQE